MTRDGGGGKRSVSLAANDEIIHTEQPSIIDSYVSHPEPGPIPAPPPVPDGHPDMVTYEEMKEENSNIYSEPKKPELGPSPMPGPHPSDKELQAYRESLNENNLIDYEIVEKDMQIDELVNRVGGKDINALSYIQDNMLLDEKVNRIGGQEFHRKIINDTDIELRDGEINNLIKMALNSTELDNIYGPFKEFYDDGRLDVSIREYQEYELTKEEAIELYLTEQKQRNEFVFDMIEALAGTVNPKKLVSFILNKSINGDDLSGYIFGRIGSGEEKFFTAESIFEGMTDYARNKVLEGVFNLMDEMHHDINQIEGGKYIESVIQFTQNDGGTELGSNITRVRVIKINDILEFNTDNPLHMILPSLG